LTDNREHGETGDEGGIIDLGAWRERRRPAGVPEPPPARRALQVRVEGDGVSLEVLEDGKPVTEMLFTEDKANKLAGQIRRCVNSLLIKRFKAEGRCFTSGKLVSDCHCYAHQLRKHWVVNGKSACGITGGPQAAETWKEVTCWRCRKKRPRVV
jgi:hypothetical protein